MNTYLSGRRLSLLIKNHLVENQQKYLLYLAGILFIGVIVFGLSLGFENYPADYYQLEEGEISNKNDITKWEGIQVALYLFGLFIFGGIFASSSFVNFSNNAEVIFYMNKPASQLEKWITEVVVHTVFFMVAYTLVFYLIDIPSTLLVRVFERNSYLYDLQHVLPEEMKLKIFHPSQVVFFGRVPFFEYGGILFIVVSGFVSAVSFFMYGAVLFNRFSFFKTLLLAFVLGVFYFFYLLFVSSDVLLPEDWSYNFPVDASKHVYNSMGFETGFDSSLAVGLYWFVGLVVPIGLLYCSYLKLTEKEV